MSSGYQFYPRIKYITDISNAQYAVVTMNEDHDFTDGEIVGFRVTKPFGMVEINDRYGKVLSHTSDTITVDIDTMNFTSFIYPVSGKLSPPTCVPAASGIIPGLYPSTMNLQDAFDNRPT
jgi:hypothetical protein